MIRRSQVLYAMLFVSVIVGALVLRWAGIHQYPVLGPDEGLWNVEAKDAVRFGDRTLSGLPQVFAGPLHFGINWCLFHIMPATVFSIRLLSGWWGGCSLLIVAALMGRRYGSKVAMLSAVLVGFSFAMVLINRRAYLESGVILLSVLAMLFATSTWRYRSVCLGLVIALLVCYKSYGIYLVPCLLIPEVDSKQDVLRRLCAVVCGLAAGSAVLYLVSRLSPGEAAVMWDFEFTQCDGEPALLRIGRFGLYPHVLMRSVRDLVVGYTDVVLLSATGLVAFVATRAWQDRFALRMVVWLLAGYAFILGQGWQHPQYFAPLIIPAGLLTVCTSTRATRVPWASFAMWAVMTAVVGMSLARIGFGWRRACADNRPLEASRWLEKQPLGEMTFLACPEVVIMTERKGYPFNRIFHPLNGSRPPALSEVIAARHVRYIILDQWETAPNFADDPGFLSELAAIPRVAEGKGWIAYRVPDAQP